MMENWEHQKTTNETVTEHFDKIKATMSQIMETLARMEANQRFNSVHRNNITSPSGVREVRNPNQSETGENQSLGYRKASNALENQNGMSKKIEFPIFDGSYPYSWISLAERFFRLGNYSDDERLDLLSMNFQSSVLNWFHLEIKREPFRDWLQFKRRRIARFSTTKKQSPSAVILKKDSVSEIVQELNQYV
ncbi:unnamed protein product [Microthlaspi erraticum]|uniref:Retrotransposon gag domain-containing protein n=1 Tax=Microthlaspi erraticum TaxID=1685480 RepID=A0A6D2J8T1_9BRAS|nr:unnamed protein product [Microthlaspi erraticum]